MLYGLLADLTVLLHAAFVLFVVFGGFAALRWPKVALAHLPAAAWGIWIELSHGICPLTPLENRLRRLAGDEGYAGGFIDRYVVSYLYPAGLTPLVQNVLAFILCAITAIVYGILAARIIRRRRAGA